MTPLPTTDKSPAVWRWIAAHPDRLIGWAIFFATLMLYIATLAPGLVFGDPAEYTFVPHIWGIAHPPGYAFQTVLGGLWQRLVPIGSIAYRANLLSAAAGAGIAALVYGTVRALTPASRAPAARYVPSLLAAISVATATDLWQHSIHANAHIITALLAIASQFSLLKWIGANSVLVKRGIQEKADDRWLLAFCVLAGLSMTHHPLLVFSFPAYAAFIVAVRPRILLDWHTLLKMLGWALLGLSIWLYLPIRASLPTPVPFGPDNTNTLAGFLDLTLARGLRVNLFHFGLADQPDRLRVFGSLLSLQAGMHILALIPLGLIWLWRTQWRAGLLLTLFLGINLLFILNTIQDVMAYLMTPLVALMTLAGLGSLGLFQWLRLPAGRDTGMLHAALTVTLITPPILRAGYLAPLISLRDYREAQAWVEEVYSRFEGQSESAILLADWEHLTPLWYEAWVEDHPLAESDLRLIYVATTSERPWADNAWANFAEGPVYTSGYRRELVEEGFRLRPVGPTLYRVLPPPATEPVAMQTPLDADAGVVTVAGIDLPVTHVEPGQEIPLVIALTAEGTSTDIIFPYVTLGETAFHFTTDSHFLSPSWQAGETIVERYDLRAPLTAEPGEYPLRIGLRNLSQGGEPLAFPNGSTSLEVGTITIVPPTRWPVDPEEEGLLADINHEVGLVGAVATAPGQRRIAVWQEPLTAHPSDDLHIRLTWRALNRPGENYKVFVHLVDASNQVIAQQDAPPLGGAFPTFLWFPKWVPGQTVVDPYRLTIPPGTPPGEYWIEVGLYGFSTFQRAPFYDPAGNLSGDFFILGTVQVEP